MEDLAIMAGMGVNQGGMADESPNAEYKVKPAYGSQARRKPKQTPNDTCDINGRHQIRPLQTFL